MLNWVQFKSWPLMVESDWTKYNTYWLKNQYNVRNRNRTKKKEKKYVKEFQKDHRKSHIYSIGCCIHVLKWKLVPAVSSYFVSSWLRREWASCTGFSTWDMGFGRWIKQLKAHGPEESRMIIHHHHQPSPPAPFSSSSAAASRLLVAALPPGMCLLFLLIRFDWGYKWASRSFF